MATDWNKLRSDIYLRDNGICWICKTFVSLGEYDLGHLVDRANGGHDDYDNLVVMHRLCNHSKPRHDTLEECLRWQLTFNIENMKQSRGLPQNISSKKSILNRNNKNTESYILEKTRRLTTVNPKTQKRQIERFEYHKSLIKPCTICWIHGRPNGGAMWLVIPPPYAKENRFSMRLTPPGATDNGLSGIKETLQVIGGELDDIVNIDVGFIKVSVYSVNGETIVETSSNNFANSGNKLTVGRGKHQISVSEWSEFKELGLTFTEFIDSYKSVNT